MRRTFPANKKEGVVGREFASLMTPECETAFIHSTQSEVQKPLRYSSYCQEFYT